jgi:hypothetical protein
MLLTALISAAFTNASLYAFDGSFSILLDSTVNAVVPAGDGDGAVHFGIEEYANLRLKSYVGDYGTFYGAFNIIAASGLNGQSLGYQNGTQGDNFVSAIELERLYVSIAGEKYGLDAGLMRLAFGYGQVFSPSDFLNPRNPLFPDARPRAILGAAFSLYPGAMSQVRAFAVSPEQALATSVKSLIAGLSAELHTRAFSAQALYAYQGMSETAPEGTHRMGLSLKSDFKAGLYAELFAEYSPLIASAVSDTLPLGRNGIALEAGLDYTVSFPVTNLYLLACYLYSDEGSVTARTQTNAAGFTGRHYIYSLARYRFSDYTSASLSCLASIDDGSFSPALGFAHELFQGAALALSLRVPLDASVFAASGAGGELGPAASATKAAFTAKLSLRL